MWKLLLTTLTAGVVGSLLHSTADAGPDYKTYRNRDGYGVNGTQLSGIAPSDTLAVHAVILPSGEVIALH